MRFTVAFGLLLTVCGFGSGAVITETDCPYLVLDDESKIIVAEHPGMPAANKTQPRIDAFITTQSRTSPGNLTAVANVQYKCADGLPAKRVQQFRHCCSGAFDEKTKKCDSVCRSAPHKSRVRRSDDPCPFKCKLMSAGLFLFELILNIFPTVW
ncbi:uncharacterized protein LOC126836474 [Adelges cooleyi]|uniref:uncharacterized protein LOC126836474 n=1 Tax=Adelges cooleyi TaxID=133065 RepID=UPI00217FE132|nr:uncharacterized protein LOC126836474 [Adelges cooleyi]